MKSCRFSKQKNWWQVENTFYEATQTLLVITYSYSKKPLLQNTRRYWNYSDKNNFAGSNVYVNNHPLEKF